MVWSQVILDPLKTWRQGQGASIATIDLSDTPSYDLVPSHRQSLSKAGQQSRRLQSLYSSARQAEPARNASRVICSNLERPCINRWVPPVSTCGALVKNTALVINTVLTSSGIGLAARIDPRQMDATQSTCVKHYVESMINFPPNHCNGLL